MTMITPAVMSDADELAATLRRADLEEIAAGSGRNPLDVLRDGIKYSAMAWTARVDGKVAAIFGVMNFSLLGGIGVPWLLGSDLIDTNKKAFVRGAMKYLHIMLEAYPTLKNVVHAKNTKALLWLKRTGFRIHPPVEHHGEFFHPFEIRG